MTNETTPVLAYPQTEGDEEWSEEILEAMEARKQTQNYLKSNPRPRRPAAMMQRLGK